MHKPFDFSEIEDFDSHIELSIPNYSGLMDVFKSLFLEYMPEEGTCVDLGCSTGKLLEDLQSMVPKGEYVGVDKVRMKDDYPFHFYEGDCLECLENTNYADLVFSVFTLQFLSGQKRRDVVEELKRLVNDCGATLLVAEKTYCSDSRINTVLWRDHVRQKRKAFSDSEILDKDYQLFGSMFCLTEQEIMRELNFIGKPHQVWQSYNFKAWAVTSQ